MTDEQMTRHERRRLKKLERSSVLQKEERRFRFHARHVVGLLFVVGIVGAIVYGVRYTKNSNAPGAKVVGVNETYTPGPVHWHAAFEVELCGKKQDFSSYGATSHAGSPLFHTHGDSMLHIEGRIIQKEDIALGKFFDLIDIPFGSDRIMDKKNGDECSPGKPGQVKMFVNGAPNTEFRSYIPKPTEKGSDQIIRIVFE